MFFIAWSREVAYHSNRNENKKKCMASHQAEPQQHISPTKVPRSCNFSGIPEAGRVTARLVMVWLQISGGKKNISDQKSNKGGTLKMLQNAD